MTAALAAAPPSAQRTLDDYVRPQRNPDRQSSPNHQYRPARQAQTQIQTQIQIQAPGNGSRKRKSRGGQTLKNRDDQQRLQEEGEDRGELGPEEPLAGCPKALASWQETAVANAEKEHRCETCSSCAACQRRGPFEPRCNRHANCRRCFARADGASVPHRKALDAAIGHQLLQFQELL